MAEKTPWFAASHYPMKAGCITDELLFQDIRGGDVYAFEVLFNRYYKKLCRHGRTVIDSWEVAEEIVVDVMLRLWTNREKIIITTGIEQYLFRSVHNSALNHMRDSSRREVDVVYVAEFTDDLAEEDKTFVKIFDKGNDGSIYEKFDSMIAQLPVRNQQVMNFRKEGLSYKDIAGKMNLSEKKVRNLAERTIQKLRDKFRAFQQGRYT
jgi:RNA polymerase sigma-70 factor (ECF subfamily)